MVPEKTCQKSLLSHLYGTSNQEQFDSTWKALYKESIGLILIVDNTQADPISDMENYLDTFDESTQNTSVVIVVTGTDASSKTTLEDYQTKLMERGQIFPVL